MASIEVPQFVEWRPSGQIEHVNKRTVVITDLSDRFDDPLNLLERPAQLNVYQDSDNRIYSLSLPSRLLIGEDLIKLMSAARPDFLWFELYGDYRTTEHVEYGGNRIGTLADWGFSVLSEDVKKRLILEHKQVFGPYWQEFYRFHAKQFGESVGTWSKGEYESFFDYEMGKVADRDYVIEHLSEVLSTVECHLNGKDHPAEFIRDKFDQLKDLIGDVDKNYLNTFSFFCERDEFISGLTREAKRRLVELGIIKDTKFLLDLNSEPGEKAVWPEYNPTEVSSLAYLGDSLVEVRSGESFVRFKVEGCEQREISRHIVIEEHKMMIPAIVWAKNSSGQRFYLSGEIPDLVKQSMDPRENSLLGLLLVTYLYDDIRKSLGEEWSLAGKGLNRMMEAQVLLLDSVSRNKIMEAEIFDNLEQVGQSSAESVA